MRRYALRLLVFVSAVFLALCVGCALDPMERLSEQIEAQDAKVREEAVLKLANLRDDRAIEALVEVLKSDEKVYDEAGVALVKQGREVVDPEEEDPVIKMVADIMNDDHSPTPNRTRAAWVLGEIGDREAIPALRTATVAVLADGAAAAPVRAEAKESLKKLGDSSTGVAYEIPMGRFSREIDVLPKVEPVVAEETAAEEEEATEQEDESGEKQEAPAEEKAA